MQPLRLSHIGALVRQSSRLSRLRRAPAAARLSAIPSHTLAAAVVGLAGLIHVLLAPEHFAEQVLYGVVFTALALFQLALAVALLTRPGPVVYRAGIWGSALIALVYVATRLVPPPGAAAPEEVELLGILTTGLELAALVLFALALPEPTGRSARRLRSAPVWWGIGGGLVAAPLWLIATGILQWTTADSGTRFLVWYGNRSAITPALAGSPAPHLFFFAPWWTLLGAAAIAVLVGLNLWLATRLVLRGDVSCLQRRMGLLTLLPAALSGPLCCGAPLIALFGVPAVLSLALAPYTTGLSIVLLVAQVVYLSVRFTSGSPALGEVLARLHRAHPKREER